LLPIASTVKKSLWNNSFWNLIRSSIVTSQLFIILDRIPAIDFSFFRIRRPRATTKRNLDKKILSEKSSRQIREL